jgi:hypothetical protein
MNIFLEIFYTKSLKITLQFTYLHFLACSSFLLLSHLLPCSCLVLTPPYMTRNKVAIGRMAPHITNSLGLVSTFGKPNKKFFFFQKKYLSFYF